MKGRVTMGWVSGNTLNTLQDRGEREEIERSIT